MHHYSKWTLPISQEDQFVVTVFHELLHIWLNDNLNENKSIILAKYCNEDDSVRAHIHVMAIEKMAYTKISRPDILASLNSEYCNFSTQVYRRAWKIVNEIESYEAILQDILQAIN